jgi:hypothetical protein
VTIGEVEEFLWTLSTCLEGQIGDWRVRFGGTTVSVRVDPDTDRVVLSAPVEFSPTPLLRDCVSPAGVRYHSVGSELRATLTAQLSNLGMNGLQAGFQQVVDCAHQPPPADGRSSQDSPSELG